VVILDIAKSPIFDQLFKAFPKTNTFSNFLKSSISKPLKNKAFRLLYFSYFERDVQGYPTGK